MPAEAPRLDEAALDALVEEMALASAPPPSVAARIERWYQDLREAGWTWLKRVTGGDDGPFGAIERGFSRLVREGLGLEGGEVVGQVFEWGSLLVLLLALAWLARRLGKHYLPARVPREALDYLADAGLARPLEELPREQWVPALFTHVCIDLVDAGRLTLKPSDTNLTVATKAQLPAEQASALRRLAVAADQVQYAGWQPDAEEFERLLDTRTALRSSLTWQAP